MNDVWDRAARLVGRALALNREVEKSCGLSLVQLRLLRHLQENPASTPAEAARELETHPSSLSPLLRRLVGRSWVRETIDPLDSRRKLLTVTREGRDALSRGSALLASSELEAAYREIRKI